MTVSVEIDTEKLSVRLGRVSDAIHDNVRGEMISVTQDLATLVQQKLSGAVLDMPSGRLYASIEAGLVETSTELSASISSVGVPYAAVHELGGRDFYEIVPAHARVLAFAVGAKRMFAMHVDHPPAKQRSFLRSSLDEMREVIAARLTAAARAGATGA